MSLTILLLISGETFKAIGISLLNLFFSAKILSNKFPNSSRLWKSLKFSVLGEEILIVI